MLRSRRANAHLLVKFNASTSQRLLNWNPIPKLTIVSIWKTPTCLKFGTTSYPVVENLPQRNLWVWAANDAQTIWVVRGAIHSGKKWRSALWLNTMHPGQKWRLREFVPAIFRCCRGASEASEQQHNPDIVLLVVPGDTFPDRPEACLNNRKPAAWRTRYHGGLEVLIDLPERMKFH